MDWRKFKKGWKKVWYFIWEDDSWASWFVNIVLAFVIIKFLVYPGLGLVFSTTHPIVAVVSSSMEHDGNFDEWWGSEALCPDGSRCTQEEYYAAAGIDKDRFRDYRFWNGFNKGDLMFLLGTRPSKIEIGDTIVYQAGRPDPIIHRVISVSEEDGHYAFMTKGDHNPGVFYFESYIPQENLIGRAVFRLPYLGYVKIGFVKLLSLVGIV